MDINKLLRCINNLNDYITSTNDLSNKYANSKVLLNMSTVLALKKIRSLEVEYFNKCDENGAAFKVFDMMLLLPPSKTWSILGQELISIIQYWLDALKKHLIIHKKNWWIFLKPLLKFIQGISLKNKSINNKLVQETAESLFDLATNKHIDIVHRHRILQVLNSCCADSSREIRFAMRSKFTSYMLNLSTILASCGDICLQYSIMETLLRWLVPRRDMCLRKQTAEEWFPKPLYSKECTEIFLERAWVNFFKDARDFLNAHNKTNTLVTSIICKHFAIGNLILISESDEHEYWLDINTCTRSISMMLQPKLLEILGGVTNASDVLVITEGNVNKLKMYRNAMKIIIEVTLMEPGQLFPNVTGDVKININSFDWSKVDRAMRIVLQDKYEVLTDKEIVTTVGNMPSGSRNLVAKFGPVETRRGHSGVVVRSRIPLAWRSPSTASTSSLAMLRERLSAFSGCKFDREIDRVCAAPPLSNVTELSESEEHSFYTASTLKLRRCGQSVKRKSVTDENARDDSKEKFKEGFSPIIEEEENSLSCLLVATIGSVDDSVINETLNRISLNRSDNIVDLLMQEAFNSKGPDKPTRTEVKNNSYLSTSDSRDLETKVVAKELNLPQRTIISNSATEESNVDIVEPTPYYVNVGRYKNIKNTAVNENKESDLDHQTVEEFFSQHLYENREKELIISPTLARKINETSSDSSEDFDYVSQIVESNFGVNDIDIIECLNDIVDTVCKDFDKCTEYLDKKIENMSQKNLVVADINTIMNTPQKKRTPNKVVTRSATKAFTLKYTSSKINNKKARAKQKNTVLEWETIKKMSPIVEGDSAIENLDIVKTPVNSIDNLENVNILTRRKRKLYSPKDEDDISKKATECVNDTASQEAIQFVQNLNDFENHTMYNKTPNPVGTSYKELENIRRNSQKRVRNKKIMKESLSPRSKTMNDVFDNLKNTIEGEKDVILVKKNIRNKAIVYNFTSDSDDDNFVPKNKTSKQLKSKSIATQSQRPNTRSNKQKGEKIVALQTENNNENKRKLRSKRKTEQKNKSRKHKLDLIDERMREPVKDILDISMELDNSNNSDECVDIEVKNTKKSEMEMINENENNNEVKRSKLKLKKNNKRTISTKVALINEMSGPETTECQTKPYESDKTASPLPGLLVEAIPKQKDPEDSFTNTIIENLQSICNDGKLQDIPAGNTTQNLLLDIEAVTYNPAKLNLNTIENNSHKSSQTTSKSKEIEECGVKLTNTTKRPKKKHKKIINISNSQSDKSIKTIGMSPITAHGDFDEEPPDFEHLTQSIKEPRALEIEYFNKSLKQYFQNLHDNFIQSITKSNTSERSDGAKEAAGSKEYTSKPNYRSPTVTVCRLSSEDIKKWLPRSHNSVFDSNASSDVHITKKCLRSHRNSSEQSNHTTPIAHEFRKSIISPIKLFDEIGLVNRSIENDVLNVENIKSVRVLQKSVSNESNRVLANRDFTEHSPNSTRVEETVPLKRKTSPVLSVVKIRKITDTVTESSPGVSSIHDWFDRNEQASSNSVPSRAPDLPLKDVIESMLESIDTTLIEINHNTSEKFVSMFTAVQKRLDDMKQDRQQSLKETASELLSTVVKQIDVAFTNLDQRYDTTETQFMVNIKEQARTLIHEDCKQKSALVKLLKEDALGALDNIANKQKIGD